MRIESVKSVSNVLADLLLLATYWATLASVLCPPTSVRCGSDHPRNPLILLHI